MDVRAHEDSGSPKRDDLEDDRRLRMVAVEIELVTAVENALEDVRNIFWHKSLIATVNAQWRACWYTPSPKTLFGLWDHMATIYIAYMRKDFC